MPRFPNALLAAAALTALASGCGTYTTTSDVWLIPGVIARQGSPIVIVSDAKLHAVLRQEPGSFWSEAHVSPTITQSGWSSRELDVRTCKAGPRRAYAQDPFAPGGPFAGEAAYSTTGTIGSVRFSIDPLRSSDLLAADDATGQRWIVATAGEGIRSVVAVPEANRVLFVTENKALVVYDLRTRRVSRCLG